MAYKMTEKRNTIAKAYENGMFSFACPVTVDVHGYSLLENNWDGIILYKSRRLRSLF